MKPHTGCQTEVISCSEELKIFLGEFCRIMLEIRQMTDNLLEHVIT